MSSNLQSSSMLRSRRRPARRGATSVAKQVRAIMNSGPAKFAQSLHTEVSVTNASNPVYFDFPAPTPGAQESSRLGNSIKVKDIALDVILNNNSTASAAGMLVRIAILEVKAGNSYTNSNISSTLFEPTVSGTQDVTAYLDIRDISSHFNREPCRVLYDEIVIVSPSTAAATDAGIAQVHVRMPYSRLWRYQDGDTTDPVTNRLTVCLLARDAANDGGAITVEASGRTSITYHDHI